MARGIDRSPDRADVRGDARRGLVVHHQYRRVGFVPPVLPEAPLDLLRGQLLAPAQRHFLDLVAQVPRRLGEQGAEMAVVERQDALTRRQHVHQRCLPRPGPRRRVEDDRTLARAEDLPQGWQDLPGQLGELGAPVVYNRPVHRPQDAIGHVRRPGDLQEGSPTHAHLDSSSCWSSEPFGLSPYRRAFGSSFYGAPEPARRWISLSMWSSMRLCASTALPSWMASSSAACSSHMAASTAASESRWRRTTRICPRMVFMS